MKATFSLYPDKDALADLEREVRPVYSYNPLVQINPSSSEGVEIAEESRA